MFASTAYWHMPFLGDTLTSSLMLCHHLQLKPVLRDPYFSFTLTLTASAEAGLFFPRGTTPIPPLAFRSKMQIWLDLPLPKAQAEGTKLDPQLELGYDHPPGRRSVRRRERRILEADGLLKAPEFRDTLTTKWQSCFCLFYCNALSYPLEHTHAHTRAHTQTRLASSTYQFRLGALQKFFHIVVRFGPGYPEGWGGRSRSEERRGISGKWPPVAQRPSAPSCRSEAAVAALGAVASQGSQPHP